MNDASLERRDDTLRTARWLIVTFGTTNAGTVLGTLQASSNPIVKAGYDSLVSTGLDLSHATTQSLIQSVGTAAGWSSGLIASLKAAGVWYVSPAENGLGREATLDDVEAAREWAQTMPPDESVLLSLNLPNGVDETGSLSMRVGGDVVSINTALPGTSARELALVASIGQAIAAFVEGA